MTNKFDVVVIGAGAAGLMCAITAGQMGKSVLLLERNKSPGAKILISGGGRCNFTNERVTADAYISDNPHFVKSALARYTHLDFLDFMNRNQLTWHEKTLGQLFCDQGAKAILKALIAECQAAGVDLRTSIDITDVTRSEVGFQVSSDSGTFTAKSLVVAAGGLSIPKMGATDFGYKLARQFGLKVVEPRPALVPLTFAPDIVEGMKQLAGVSAPSVISLPPVKTEQKRAIKAPDFRENLLFTHRGLSGPAVLQISSYWQPGGDVQVNLLPEKSGMLDWLKQCRDKKPTAQLKAVLSSVLPARLSEYVTTGFDRPIGEQSNANLEKLADRITCWHLTPTGTEGFKKAEVTSGGVSTAAISSKTMEAKNQPGLYFIGECVDVTGWLGGYNFQWAWASGFVAGQSA